MKVKMSDCNMCVHNKVCSLKRKIGMLNVCVTKSITDMDFQNDDQFTITIECSEYMVNKPCPKIGMF